MEVQEVLAAAAQVERLVLQAAQDQLILAAAAAQLTETQFQVMAVQV
jgi:hypothetical protein